MTDELRTFRAELAVPSPAADTRVRRRLESRIAGESRAGREGTRGRRGSTAAGAAAVSACAAAVLVATAGLGDGRPSGTARTVERATASGWPAGWPGRGGRVVGPARAESPDGLLTSLPSLDGRDAGSRPTDDRGGWSECATGGCYSES